MRLMTTTLHFVSAAPILCIMVALEMSERREPDVTTVSVQRDVALAFAKAHVS